MKRYERIRSEAVSTLSEGQIGHEARARRDDQLDVKIWLRLFACCLQIEQSIGRQLRTRFGTTLPRFDYLAQLERYPAGLQMSVLSRYLMVSGANVTGLTDLLVRDGLVQRSRDPQDRRAYLVTLTLKGRSEFAKLATEHEIWLRDMFKDVPLSSKQVLYEHLGRLRVLSSHSSESAPKE